MRHGRFKTPISWNWTVDDELDSNDRFVLLHCAIYLKRLLDRFNLPDNENTQMLLWVLRSEANHLKDLLIKQMSDREKKIVEREVEDSCIDQEEHAGTITRILNRSGKSKINEYLSLVRHLMDKRIKQLSYRKNSVPDKKLTALAGMFGLTEDELSFCRFIYIVSSWKQPEEYFVDHLCCNSSQGRKYLTTILGIGDRKLSRVFEGTLANINFFEMDRHFLKLTEGFEDYFQKDSSQWQKKHLFAPVTQKAIPLESHIIDPLHTGHVLNLLKAEGSEPVHILLYGKPGTGKTSYAIGLVNKIGFTAYEILREKENMAINRRAAIIACMKTTRQKKESIIIVDEADNLLNTEDAWSRRGETQDKGWLNQLLEEPGSKMIWITNNTQGLDLSVARRFAFSLYFKPFSRQQRIQLWESILYKNRVKRYLDKADIANIAKEYDVNAGIIETAVRKARISCKASDNNFKETVIMTLNAHETLCREGRNTRNREKIENQYSLDGLNTGDDIGDVMKQIEMFDTYLRNSQKDDNKNFNLLFYGPPGTGKSELARYIAEHLDRDLMVKRINDILSCWVGETEKNIADMFSDAENREAVLVLDEADSLLFNRERAVRSWEISHTNEFLTQMERFRGILICTTNRMHDLDDASIRRFNHKIRFDYLDPEGNVIFYHKMLAHLTDEIMNDKVVMELKELTHLAPGDFRVIRDQYAYYPKGRITHQMMINALKQEINVRKLHEGIKPIGF